MSFAVTAHEALQRVIVSGQTATTTPGEVILEELVEVLEDTAVRREVFDDARWELEECSISDVHTVMDSLIKVLKGENHDD